MTSQKESKYWSCGFWDNRKKPRLSASYTTIEQNRLDPESYSPVLQLVDDRDHVTMEQNLSIGEKEDLIDLPTGKT